MTIFLGFKIFDVIHFLEWLCCLIKSEDSYQEMNKKTKQVAEETPDTNFVSDLEDLVLFKPEMESVVHNFH